MENSIFWWVIGGVVCVLLIIGCMGVYSSTEQHVEFTVTAKENVHYRDSSKYLIFTSGETYQVSDTLTYGRFNSSDVYGQIKAGSRYSAKVVGWRIPFFSSYRNIIQINEVK